MISFSYHELLELFSIYFWPFLRLLGLFMTAPLFSESGIPARIKIGLAEVFSILIGPMLPTPYFTHGNHYEILFLVLTQTLIGLLMGLTMRISFSAVKTAEAINRMQMGR